MTDKYAIDDNGVTKLRPMKIIESVPNFSHPTATDYLQGFYIVRHKNSKTLVHYSETDLLGELSVELDEHDYIEQRMEDMDIIQEIVEGDWTNVIGYPEYEHLFLDA